MNALIRFQARLDSMVTDAEFPPGTEEASVAEDVPGRWIILTLDADDVSAVGDATDDGIVVDVKDQTTGVIWNITPQPATAAARYTAYPRPTDPITDHYTEPARRAADEVVTIDPSQHAAYLGALDAAEAAGEHIAELLKIPEPTGLGAIVADSHSRWYVRACPGDCPDGRGCVPWTRIGWGSTHTWEQIDGAYVVRHGTKLPTPAVCYDLNLPAPEHYGRKLQALAPGDQDSASEGAVTLAAPAAGSTGAFIKKHLDESRQLIAAAEPDQEDHSDESLSPRTRDRMVAAADVHARLAEVVARLAVSNR